MKKLFWPSALALLFCLFLPRPSQGASGIGNDNPTGVTGEYNGSVTTGGSYDPYTGNAKRFIDDLTVTGSIGDYPLKWTRILNTRGGSGKFGDGGGWTHNYRWGLTLQPHPGLCGQTCICEGPDGSVYYPDGRIMNLRWEEEPHAYVQADGQEPMGDRLVHVDGGSGNYYDLWMKDGGRVEFRPAPGVSGATAIVDPYGLRTTIEYDASGRLWKITEPGGRFLQISYQPHCYWNQVNPPQYVCTDVISQVEAHDGLGHMMEKVMYSYEEVYAQGLFETMFVNLTQVAYDDGSHASYVYNDPARVNPGNPWSLCAGTVKTCNDVRYAGPMSKIEYEYVPSEGGQAGAYIRGQIKAERNMTTHQVVSSVDYQGGLFDRTEIRPDGATRHFGYRGVDGLDTYTNFTYSGETPRNTTIAFTDHAPGNPDHYLRTVTDALGHATTTEKERKIGAVMAVIHHDGSKIEYTYSEPEPYYLATRKDENLKTTTYTRNLDTHQVERIDYPDDGFETFTYYDNPLRLLHEHRMTSGGTEIFEYDSRGLKTTYTPPFTPSDPGQHTTRYFYYQSGPHTDRLQYMVDPRENATWYEYNLSGLVTKVTHQDTTFIQNEYYPDGTLHWTEDELGHRTTYTNDEYKRVTEVKNHLNETVTNSYARNVNDPQGLSHTTSSIYLTTSFMGRQIKYDYDANFRRTMTKQAPGDPDDEATTNFTYDWVGNLKRVEDPRHKFTSYGYDERNRQTSIWNEELNETTTVIYDPADNKEKETRQDGAFRTWDYDAMNRLWHAYDWRMSDPPTLNQTTTYDHDHAGNVQFITDTKGTLYEYGYDWLNRKISATYPSDNTLPQRTETWLYDYAGNLLLHKNPAEQYQHFVYDDRNRQRRSYWNMFTAADTTPNWSIGPEITITPDAASRITEIKTNNGETVVGFGYDDANRKIWEDQTQAGQPTRRVQTDLDGDGKRLNLQIVDPPQEGGELIFSLEMSGTGSYLVTYDYTMRNQLKTISGNPGENWAFHYTYDPSGNMITRRADYNGRTSWTKCPNDDYDALNRPRTWEQSGPNGFYALSHYQYDQVNREEATWRDEDNHRGEHYEYEVTDQLKKVSYNINISPTPTPPNATPTPPNTTPTPPPNATPTPPQQQAAMPTFNPAGRNYFPLNSMPITIATTTTGAQISWTNDGSDPAPNHGTVIPTSSGTMSTGYRESFTLKAIAFKPGLADSAINEDGYYWDNGEAPTAGGRTVNYVYTPDKLNRSSMNDNGAETNYSANALNQYTSTAGNSFSYDDNFNLTHTAGFNGVYDAANRLVSASNAGSGEAQTTLAGFVYDGLGRCVKRTLNGVGTVFIYDGWKVIGEWEESVPDYFQAWNVYGPGADEILLRQGGKYGYVRFQSDRHGNVAFLVDNDGVIQEKYTYDVFGQPKITDATGNVERNFSYYGHAFLFQGREYIRELGIYDYRHRFYHPGLGRFIQTDPLGFDAGDMNLYRYCDDDPVDHTDPMGTYAQGSGWNKDNWEKFRSVQENAAKVTGTAADRIESALKNGGKELDALKKDFERVYGPGSATEKNLREVGTTLRGMETALRDNGQLGYYANAATKADAVSQGLSKDTAAWTYPSDRHSLIVNTDHTNFGKPSLVGTVIHESSHNLGLIDATRDKGGVKAYRHGNLVEQAYFKQLPFKEPDKALRNADTLTSFVVP